MSSFWAGNTFECLGYQVTVYSPTNKNVCRLVIYVPGGEDPIYSEYFASEAKAKEFAIEFIVQEAKEQLEGFGYTVVKTDT
jgi:hypothetical protein